MAANPAFETPGYPQTSLGDGPLSVESRGLKIVAEIRRPRGLGRALSAPNIDNSPFDRQTTAFAGKRIWRASADGVSRHTGPSPALYLNFSYVHGHDRATGVLYARLLVGDDRQRRGEGYPYCHRTRLRRRRDHADFDGGARGRSQRGVARQRLRAGQKGHARL